MTGGTDIENKLKIKNKFCRINTPKTKEICDQKISCSKYGYNR